MGRIPPIKRNRENCLFMLLIAVVMTAEEPQSSFGSANVDAFLDGLGTIVLLFGAVVRVCARGWKHEQRGRQLVTSGPYSWIRHPLYFGTLLAIVGLCMIHGSILVFGLSMLAFAVWYMRVMWREETRLRALWPKAHEIYCATVPWLVPSPLDVVALLSTWPKDVRWAICQEADALFLLPMAAVVIRVWEITESGPLWVAHPAQATALFMVIGLLVGAWALARQPHIKRRAVKRRDSSSQPSS